MDEAEGKEPALDFLDPRVVVQQPEACPDPPPIDLREDGQFGHDEVLHGLGDVLHFSVGHGNEAPGVGQRAVVDREERFDLFQESGLVQRPDLDVAVLDDLFRDGRSFSATLGSIETCPQNAYRSWVL